MEAPDYAAARVKPLPLRSIVLQALLVAFMAWLYGGDLVRLARLLSAKVAVMTAQPSLALSVVGLLVTGALGASVAISALRNHPARWRVRRLSLVAAATLLLVDLGVLANRRTPMTVEESLVLTLHALAEDARAASGTAVVLRDPQELRALVARAPAPPLFVDGEKLAGWKLELRERCGGPAAEAGSAGPGTFLYCVSEDRSRAWVTVVATRDAQTFGSPAVIGTEAPWVAVVTPRPPDEPSEPSVWEPPTPDEGP